VTTPASAPAEKSAPTSACEKPRNADAKSVYVETPSVTSQPHDHETGSSRRCARESDGADHLRRGAKNEATAVSDALVSDTAAEDGNAACCDRAAPCAAGAAGDVVVDAASNASGHVAALRRRSQPLKATQSVPTTLVPAASTAIERNVSGPWRAAAMPRAVKNALSEAARAGPTTAPDEMAAEMSARREVVSWPPPSVTAACATGTLAANMPASIRANVTLDIELLIAVQTLAVAAPAKQSSSTGSRPMRLDRATSAGQPSICAPEKLAMTRLSCVGVAPMDVRKSGRVAIVTPTPSICTNTHAQTAESMIGLRPGRAGNESLEGLEFVELADMRNGRGCLCGIKPCITENCIVEAP